MKKRLDIDEWYESERSKLKAEEDKILSSAS